MTWKRLLLKDVCEVFADGDWVESKDQSTEGIRLIQTGNIGFGFFKDKEDKSRFVSNETFKRLKCTEIFAGDLLVSRLPDPVGKSCIIPEINSRMITGVDCTILRPKDFLNSNFLCYYQMSQNYLKDVYKGISGSTRQRISRKNLGLIEVPIPPLKEQQRIVAILDEAFAKIDKAKANAEQNLKNVKELFESYLQGVFENKGDDWEEKRLNEITNKIGSGATPKGGNESYKSEGISLIRSMNVHDFEFRVKNLAFIDEQQAKELNNVTLQEDDVLLNITGASIARCCIIPKEYLPARVNQHVSIIRAKKEIIDPVFLNQLLASKFYKDQLLFTGEQGSTRQAITKAQLEVFKVSYPKSLSEQQILLQKINKISLETKRVKSIYEQKINDLEELKRSVLQKAFSGEL
jgi:type I restriction enzyme S subunit